MKTTMKQTEQELNGNLNKFAHLALTDREMVKLFGGASTGTTGDGDTTSEAKPVTTTTSNSGSIGNNDNPPPIVKED